MTEHQSEGDVVIIKPTSLTGVVLLAAVVGGVIGFLVCEFVAGDEADVERAVESTEQAAIHQSYMGPDLPA